MSGQISNLNDTLWVCRDGQLAYHASVCSLWDASSGEELASFLFNLDKYITLFHMHEASRLTIVGCTANIVATILNCNVRQYQLLCEVLNLPDTRVNVASYVPFVAQTVFIGTTSEQLSSIVWDGKTNLFRSFVYSAASNVANSVAISHAQSTPRYVGVFFAGTCASASSAHYQYILAGVMRTDSGSMKAMYVSPARGNIISSAELVNAMVLEYEYPDSFIAGGLQLEEGVGMNAYLLRINALFQSVEYGMRYQVKPVSTPSGRRSLRGHKTQDCVVKSVVYAKTALFLIVNVLSIPDGGVLSSVAIVKVETDTGLIIQQVQIESPMASLQCSHATSSTGAVDSKKFIYIACTAIYANDSTTQLLLAVHQDLTLSALPEGFRRYQNDTLRSDRIAFVGKALPLSFRSASIDAIQSKNIELNSVLTRHHTLSPTVRPSAQSSSAPSSQPSSRPTAAPSVSPQPTSQPSSSGPTNTYKPTVHPTLKPSSRPSHAPTKSSSSGPTPVPTIRPTSLPTERPSVKPTSVAPSRSPIRAPTKKPSAVPTVTVSLVPSAAPSLINEKVAGGTEGENTLSIMMYVIGTLTGIFCIYQLGRLFLYKMNRLKHDKKLVAHMTTMDLPAQPQYPSLPRSFANWRKLQSK